MMRRNNRILWRNRPITKWTLARQMIAPVSTCMVIIGIVMMTSSDDRLTMAIGATLMFFNLPVFMKIYQTLTGLIRLKRQEKALRFSFNDEMKKHNITTLSYKSSEWYIHVKTNNGLHGQGLKELKNWCFEGGIIFIVLKKEFIHSVGDVKSRLDSYGDEVGFYRKVTTIDNKKQKIVVFGSMRNNVIFDFGEWYYTENRKGKPSVKGKPSRRNRISRNRINKKESEKLTPFYMGEHEGMPALCYEVSGFKEDVFKSVKTEDIDGLVGDVGDWEELAICYLNINAPLLKDEIEVGSSEMENNFWALSDNLVALEEFAYGFRKMCDDDEQMKQLLASAYDFSETSDEDSARVLYGKVMFESKPLNENGFTVTLFRKGIGIKKEAKFYRYGFDDFKIVRYNESKGKLVLKGFFRRFRLNADVNDVQEIYNRLSSVL